MWKDHCDHKFEEVHKFLKAENCEPTIRNCEKGLAKRALRKRPCRKAVAEEQLQKGRCVEGLNCGRELLRNQVCERVFLSSFQAKK